MKRGFGMFNIMLRSALAFLVLLILTRLMGKKHIAQVTFFDYVTGISIGSIAAAISIDKSISISGGLMSLLIWSGLTIGAGYLSLLNLYAMKLIDGEPTLVIRNGKILEKSMAKIQYNVEDLLMLLRNQGIFDPSEVEFALLEANGALSVLAKSQHRPLTPKDINVATNYIGMVHILIVNGKIMKENLSQIGLTEAWLMEQLKSKEADDLREIVLATLDTNGNFYIDQKNDANI
jgi:uncharacterized membrane protein YcaP (DUF421 family)